MRYLSGIQPTGALHLGNYFAVMLPSIKSQEKPDRESIYFIADLHALTQQINPETLQKNIINAALDYLACGLDPDKIIFFRQSQIPEITQIAWILANFTPLGLLERSHSYKDKIAKGLPTSAGLFTYPILMSADILAYDSDVVPVGKDQKQHLEITRDIAQKINNFYKSEVFKIPNWEIKESTAIIPGIDGEKMSKSYGNTIPLFDNEKAQRKRFMKIVTDSASLEQPKNPEQSIIFQIYSLFANKIEIENMREKFLAGGHGYGEFKQELFEKYLQHFAPMLKKRKELESDLTYVEEILNKGAEKAREISSRTLKRAKKIIGIL